MHKNTIFTPLFRMEKPSKVHKIKQNKSDHERVLQAALPSARRSKIHKKDSQVIGVFLRFWDLRA